MAGTIVTDRIESDASYASSVNIASPLVIANTISLGSSATITGNVNIDNGTLFVNQNNNRVGIGGITNPSASLDVAAVVAITENSVASANSFLELYSRFSDNQRGYVVLKAESNSSGSSDLVIRSRNNFSEAEKFRIDSVGRMRVPNQPAFSVYSNSNLAVGSGVQAIYLNTKDIDIGNNFNTSTGRFTAPVSGQYLFNAIVAVDSTASIVSYLSAELRKNGGRFIWNGWNSKPSSTNTYVNSTGTYIVTLAAGDFIELGTEVSASVTLVGSYASGCKLSGFLIG